MRRIRVRALLLSICLLVVLLNISEAASQNPGFGVGDHYGIDLMSQWNYGPCITVAVRGDTAYFSNGRYLEIYDCTDKGNIEKVSELLLPWADDDIDITIAGDYLYMADGLAGLQIIDVSNAANPHLTGSLEDGFLASRIAVSGDYAFVAAGFLSLGTKYGLASINISDPNHPILADTIFTGGDPEGVAVSGDFAYVADSGIIRVIDISDPHNLSARGVYDPHDDAEGIFIRGNLAYVAGGHKGLIVLDVSNPDDPFLVCSEPTGGEAEEIDVSGDYAYVADWNGTVSLIDISDPESGCHKISDCSGVKMFSDDVAVWGTHFYVAGNYSGLHIFNADFPDIPVEVAHRETPGPSSSIAVSGDYALVGNAMDGLRIFDISDPAHPDTIGFCGISSPMVIAISGNYAYAAAKFSGIISIDISNPSNPAIEDSLTLPFGFAEQLFLSGDRAFVAWGESGLWIVDISSPNNLTAIGSWDNPAGEACGVTVSGNYAYLANGGEGVHVIDISTPDDPQFIRTVETNSYARAVTVDGEYLYIANDEDGLRIYDLSDPSNPDSVGHYDTEGQAIDVAVLGGWAYVADGWAGLRMINVGDPSNPRAYGYYRTGCSACDVFACTDGAYGPSSDYIYVADYVDGIYFFRVPSIAALVQGYSARVAHGQAWIEWKLNERIETEQLLLFRKELPAGQYVELHDARISSEGQAYTCIDMCCEPGVRYAYMVKMIEDNGATVLFEVELEITPPASPVLFQNYPNPFNPTTKISYFLPEAARVTLDIFDVAGRRIARLVDEERKAGHHTEVWDGRDESERLMESGLYLLRLAAGKSTLTRKIVLIR